MCTTCFSFGGTRAQQQEPNQMPTWLYFLRHANLQQSRSDQINFGGENIFETTHAMDLIKPFDTIRKRNQ